MLAARLIREQKKLKDKSDTMPKKITDYTDRELLEKSVLCAKVTAENTTFLKNYLIWMTVLSVGAIVISIFLAR